MVGRNEIDLRPLRAPQMRGAKSRERAGQVELTSVILSLNKNVDLNPALMFANIGLNEG